MSRREGEEEEVSIGGGAQSELTFIYRTSCCWFTSFNSSRRPFHLLPSPLVLFGTASRVGTLLLLFLLLLLIYRLLGASKTLKEKK